MAEKLTRRDALRRSGLVAGGMAASGAVLGGLGGASAAVAAPSGRSGPANRYTYFESLKPYYPGREKLRSGEMRITFMGSCEIPRLSQACNSVFVELGNGDSFVFDCGAGVIEKYFAVGIPYSKMDKIFITHLHGDHQSDLGYIYDFGPAGDRKSPLYVWGQSKSTVPDPVTGKIYDDGLKAFLGHLRELERWHTEAFSFLSTGYKSFKPPPWAPADKRDGYDLVPFELDWSKVGTAYDYNGVKITHFPAVHDRQGSISYKLEWNGLSMIFTGDTKPTQYVIDQATRGVDVLIHEMQVPAPIMATKTSGLKPGDPGWGVALEEWTKIIDNSHTVPKALGYILSQLKRRPRLAVATHFPAEDDTVGAALRDVRSWYPHGPVIVATDFVVLTVSKRGIKQRRAIVSDYSWGAGATGQIHTDPNPPKYSSPTAQLDPKAPVIPPSRYDRRPPRKAAG